jgi:hypothetical protein
MACIRVGAAIVTVSDGEGSAVVQGRTWRWDFHEYLGPTFVDKHGNMLKRQPGENHPVWDAFATWLTERDDRKERKPCC